MGNKEPLLTRSKNQRTSKKEESRVRKLQQEFEEKEAEIAKKFKKEKNKEPKITMSRSEYANQVREKKSFLNEGNFSSRPHVTRGILSRLFYRRK